jgi:hypothetical protein
MDAARTYVISDAIVLSPSRSPASIANRKEAVTEASGAGMILRHCVVNVVWGRS